MEQIFISSIRLNSPVKKDSYLSKLPVVRHLSAMDALNFSKQVTFLVGENGTGKSTLLEAIAIAYGFNAEGGSRNFNFATKVTAFYLWCRIVSGEMGSICWTSRKPLCHQAG